MSNTLALILRQGSKLPRLTLNLQSSCLSLLNAGIMSVHHHTWPKKDFDRWYHITHTQRMLPFSNHSPLITYVVDSFS
jgi:hypothetical protein